MKADLHGWTPVALSSDLPKGGVLRAVVEGQDLAVWRSRSGAVRAWDNRCPHRGMRLSFGFVRGESLTCIYHGWQYGTDGTCRYIPAHPDLEPPKTLRTTAFACADHAGLIWASLSDRSDPPTLDLDDAEPLRSLVFDLDMTTVGERLAEASFPITESWTPGQGHFTTIERRDGLIVREGRQGDTSRRLIALLQPLPDDRTAVHVLTSPTAPGKSKKSLSRWLERLRQFAEDRHVGTLSRLPADAALES